MSINYKDTDPAETNEWIESISDSLEHHGYERTRHQGVKPNAVWPPRLPIAQLKLKNVESPQNPTHPTCSKASPLPHLPMRHLLLRPIRHRGSYSSDAHTLRLGATLPCSPCACPALPCSACLLASACSPACSPRTP